MPPRHAAATARARPLNRQLDLNLLELFEAVYHARNLTAAGARLGLTQSAVSRGLARLREIYGDALFVRQQRGVSPTPFADALVTPVATALEILRGTVQRPTFDPATAVRTFRVAMSDIGERLFVGELMDHAAEHAPGVVIEAVAPSPALQDELAAGQVDLAVGYFGALSKQLHQRRLFNERFVYIARRGHPQVRGKLRREQLRELPHVVAGPRGMRHADAVEKVLASSRVRAHVALRVHSFLAVGPAVACTELIAPVPSNLAAVVAGHIDLQLLEPPVQFPGFDVTMAWHQRYHRDPASEWLRGVFVDLFESLKVAPPGGR